MEKTKQHLSYLILHDAAHNQKRMQPHHWAHLSHCEKCMLRLAAMLQIRHDLQDFSRKYSAA
jgi:hypothetical protein